MPGKSFWQGFEKAQEKKADAMDFPEIMEQGKDDERVNQPPPLLARTISKAGPVLADLTSESDRAKFQTFKG